MIPFIVMLQLQTPEGSTRFSTGSVRSSSVAHLELFIEKSSNRAIRGDFPDVKIRERSVRHSSLRYVLGYIDCTDQQSE